MFCFYRISVQHSKIKFLVILDTAIQLVLQFILYAKLLYTSHNINEQMSFHSRLVSQHRHVSAVRIQFSLLTLFPFPQFRREKWQRLISNSTTDETWEASFTSNVEHYFYQFKKWIQFCALNIVEYWMVSTLYTWENRFYSFKNNRHIKNVSQKIVFAFFT